LPQEDNRGRAFPWKDSGPHFVGPCIIEGKLLKIKVWKNETIDGRTYLRFVFENLTEEELKGYA
jgi:hypothetical protein